MNTGQHTLLAIGTNIIAKICVAGIALAKLVEPDSDVLLDGPLEVACSCLTISAVAWLSGEFPRLVDQHTTVVATRLTNNPA